MATFPAIEPLSRGYGFPDFPMEEESVWPNATVQYRTGVDPLAVTGPILRLDFVDLTNAQMQLIRDHWQLQQGGTIDFNLPEIVRRATPAGIYPALLRWKYLAPPEEVQKSGGRYDVSMELEGGLFLATDPA